jgi:solute carrier family 25 oxoglutarate transporter 11
MHGLHGKQSLILTITWMDIVLYPWSAQVCLVRMQADGRLPADKRRGYKNIFDALRRIAVEEGVATYWRGAGPTVARAMVVSMTQLGTYDQAKSMLIPVLGDNSSTHIASALTAAVVYSIASLPVRT